MAPLKILLLGVNEKDSELAITELERTGTPVVSQRVDADAAFTKALGEFAPDLILVEHSRTRDSMDESIDAVREHRPVAPLIVMSGGMSEREVVASVRAGAEDVIPKARIAELPEAVSTALEQRKELARLSPRQMEVLRLIALGNTNREIGKKLRVSVKTIETHRMAIMKRLGQHDVTGVVRIAVRFGIVPQQL